jgi:hypothetical protein
MAAATNELQRISFRCTDGGGETPLSHRPEEDGLEEDGLREGRLS